ncbi:hypothetical protein Nepgr_011570 [Nepenthes gracilis]|uniref:Uncharacterized protein n=1 Tax=Nepenthes gracilis TaxID=150966 RepID=A0AAD3SF33_NEPGR|nr:hypothetical protein Nepgr_011570 [Nepenthes gracilis]
MAGVSRAPASLPFNPYPSLLYSQLYSSAERPSPFAGSPRPSANSVSSSRFLKPSAKVDSLSEPSPKDALDVNGKPGHVEAANFPTDGGSRPASLTVEVLARTPST